MVGRTLAHYGIIEKLGAGGMGEVYRARDTRLERDVAIKLLPPALLSDEDARSRFRREALALARLNHPNVGTVFDFDTESGVDFLVMELVAGESLATKTASGPLTEKEIAGLGVQIASALEEAHEQHIIHRDLKPANIVITPKGQAKVLDFGLAQLLRSEAGVDDVTATLSEPDAVAGTVPYMAPEQLRGQPADARADIWALGVVLYEMASGTRPFQGNTGFALSAAILNEPPAPLPARVPAALRAIIERCLEKEAPRRYQRAGEVRAGLEAIQRGVVIPGEAPRESRGRRRAWAAAVALMVLGGVAVGFDVGAVRTRLTGTTSTAKFDSLAVLPLENLSGDPEQDYLAAGMHEALIVDLGKLSGLRRVSARASALRYQKIDRPLRQIAGELGVRALVTGTVLRSGDKVRITANLIDPVTEEQLWSDSYEREIRDVLALQNEVVAAIARQVQLQLSPGERATLARARQVNPEAYEAYLKGKFQLDRFTPEAFEKSMALFQQAISLDPAEPLAYAGLARAYTVTELFGPASPDDILRAKAAALKAVELDDRLAEAHLALALVRGLKEYDPDSARQSLRRALDLNPNLAEAHVQHGWSLAARGSEAEAIAAMKRGVELDPLSPLYTAWLGGLYWEFGRVEEAITEALKAIELQPDFPVALAVLGQAYADKGQYQEAIAAHERVLATAPNPASAPILARTYALAGRTAEARRILADSESGRSGGVPSPWFIAAAYTALGEHEKAMDWLEKAYEARILFLNNLGRERAAGFDLRPLRVNPRYQALLRKLNRAQ